VNAAFTAKESDLERIYVVQVSQGRRISSGETWKCTCARKTRHYHSIINESGNSLKYIAQNIFHDAIYRQPGRQKRALLKSLAFLPDLTNRHFAIYRRTWVVDGDARELSYGQRSGHSGLFRFWTHRGNADGSVFRLGANRLLGHINQRVQPMPRSVRCTMHGRIPPRRMGG
jgi:hypothetical protein